MVQTVEPGRYSERMQSPAALLQWPSGSSRWQRGRHFAGGGGGVKAQAGRISLGAGLETVLSRRAVSVSPRRSPRLLLRRWASPIAKIAVSAGALTLLLHNVDLVAMAEVLGRADGWDLAMVAAIYLMGQALTAWRWRLIASRVGFQEPLSDFLRFYFIGMFFNLFGPSTVGGDVVRALFLGAPSRRRAVAFHTVIFDRLSGLVMLVLVAVTAMALFGRFGLPWPMVLLVAAVGVGMLVGWFLVPPLVRRFLPADGRVSRVVDHDLKPFWTDRSLLLRAAGVSIAFHILQAASLILLGDALSMELDWRYYFIFHPLVSVLSAVPISVAGIGVREAGYVWFLQRQGVPADTAMAFGLLWFVVLLTTSLVGGAVYLWSGSAVPTLRGQRGHGKDQAGDEVQFPSAS